MTNSIFVLYNKNKNTVSQFIRKGDITMKFCKSCSCELIDSTTSKNDKRFCIKCSEQKKDFIKGRRLTLYNFRAMPLDAKIIKSKRIIQEAIYEFGLEHVYISYSGGKDSTVVSHIVRQMYPDILHIFANTTCEYPETLKHIYWEKKVNHTNIITVIPKNKKEKVWNFKNVVEYYGYPLFSKRIANAIRTYRHALSCQTKQNSLDYIQRNFKKYDQYKEKNISDKCCDILKKNPIKKKAKELGMECTILGLLASESRQREQDWLTYGCNVFHVKSENQCRPISFWNESDIQQYIEKYNVKISDLYDMGYTRNGCMYCGFGVHLETDGLNRYQRLRITHPKQYDYFVNNFGKFILEFNIAI